MSYATTNPHAVHHPLRSIPLVRPVSVLGAGFLAQHDPAGVALAQARRTLELARFSLDGAETAYAAARVRIGENNRMGRKDRHDRAIISDRTVARLRAEGFRTLNRTRGRLIQARKAVAAAETALLALAA